MMLGETNPTIRRGLSSGVVVNHGGGPTVGGEEDTDEEGLALPLRV